MQADRTETRDASERQRRPGTVWRRRGDRLRGRGLVWVCTLSVLAAFLARPGPLFAQSGVDLRREYNVKAVSLYGFGRYVTWPQESFPNASSPFVIGVMGEYLFGNALDQIAQKKTIHGRPIVVQRISSVEELHPCHILFLSRSLDEEAEAAVISQMRGKQVLLVGETVGFAQRGGMINFFLEGSSVRFELHVEAVVREQLALNAKMHSLGVRVKSP